VRPFGVEIIRIANELIRRYGARISGESWRAVWARIRQADQTIGIVQPVSNVLPSFRYHPDPLSTGSVVEASDACRSCGQRRGYIYVGPIYAAGEIPGRAICPWCIADGRAGSEFDAEFTDVGWGVPEDVPASVLREVSQRTPGFSAWQQDHWLYHCDDACAFLGRVGRADLGRYPDALDVLLHENDCFGWTAEQSRSYVDSLDASGEATAYLFRCLICNAHLAFSDTA
jgi:uncharacterized protein